MVGVSSDTRLCPRGPALLGQLPWQRLTAVIGFFALIGIEIKNSILLVDFAQQLRAEGMPLAPPDDASATDARASTLQTAPGAIAHSMGLLWWSVTGAVSWRGSRSSARRR